MKKKVISCKIKPKELILKNALRKAVGIRSDERDKVAWELLFILLHCIVLSIFVTADDNYDYVNFTT